MVVWGKGNIILQIVGVTQVITDVFYIPELKNNLLSTGQLQERGPTILIQNGACKVYHPEKGLIIQTTMSSNRMFMFLARVVLNAPICLQTTLEENTHLWHCRYGHLSFKGLRTLQQKNMVKGMPQLNVSSKVCTNCKVGKQHRDAIPKKSLWRAAQRLQLVHSDIRGPITPISNRNKRYFISFIDDYNHKVWIYFLIGKSKTFTIFKNYKNLVEKVTGLLFVVYAQIGGGGDLLSLMHFSKIMVLTGSSLQSTLLNKMEWLNARIGQS